MAKELDRQGGPNIPFAAPDPRLTPSDGSGL
jgi:hypothetical protein